MCLCERGRETHLVVVCYKAQQKKCVGGKREEKTNRLQAKARAFLELIGGARLLGRRLSEGGYLWLLGSRELGKKEQCAAWAWSSRRGRPAREEVQRKRLLRKSARGLGGVETEAYRARLLPTALASMGTSSPSSTSIPSCQDACPTYDELSMQQSLLFSDILTDLKNLRSQLYSAAEYFELSFTNDEQKQIVVDTLKDYAIKALVNTVDHLGSVSYKVNDLLDEKFDEVSGTELRVCCIEQRLRTCQEFIDLEGLTQQSLVIATPKYHKRYILPVSGSMPESGRHAAAHHQEKHQLKEDREPQLFQPCLQPTIKDRPPSFRKVFSSSPSQRARSNSPARKIPSQSPSPRPGKSQVSEKRAPSPVPASILNPLLRSGSLSSRSNVPTSSNNPRRLPTKAQKSASMRLHAERDEQEDVEHNLPSKSKRLLKALLSRRKSKKDEMLYTYIDEY